MIITILFDDNDDNNGCYCRDDSPPEFAGCLHQIYPKLASQLDHLRVVERCVALFRHFVGVRTSTRMGPTSFRMMAR